MRKYLTLLLIAAFAAVSCGKDNTITENGTARPEPVSFELTAAHPDDTKAVKTGWENGDVIFVFFDKAAAPKYLEMAYADGEWTFTEKDGETASTGCLGLSEGDAGSMRAVFLPFGSNVSVLADGSDFAFSETFYTYYLTATLEYEVAGNTVSGTFDMRIPEGYVQFFVEDSGAAGSPSGQSLATDAVIPVGVASVSADGSVTETSGKAAGDDLPGYPYKGGWLFSGKLDAGYRYDGRYYFAKTDEADGSRKDYFVKEKQLVSHKAVKLPAADDSKWLSVGKDIYIEIGGVAWQTCNYGQSAPEELGGLYDFDDANALKTSPIPSLPNVDVFKALIQSCNWYPMSIHGKKGFVGDSMSDPVFIFLPATTDNPAYCEYWSSVKEEGGYGHADYLFVSSIEHAVLQTSADRELAVRMFY